MQAAALPLMIAGNLVQGLAGYRAGQFNQKVEEANAIGDERDASAEVARIRDSARVAMGRQVGAQAESGFEVGTGTNLDSLRESQIEAEMDVMNLRRRGASAAAARRAQGEIAAAQGRQALVGGLFGAASAVANHKADYANARAAG
ncbi:MAG: hypothetical protein QOG72_2464 [Sphingomonadales bacterium]|jgi:hypothetical protein|nr:hypothetical protein [Sphingomonadales bacterium]